MIGYLPTDLRRMTTNDRLARQVGPHRMWVASLPKQVMVGLHIHRLKRIVARVDKKEVWSFGPSLKRLEKMTMLENDALDIASITSQGRIASDRFPRIDIELSGSDSHQDPFVISCKAIHATASLEIQ